MSGAQGDLFFADDDGHALQHVGLSMQRGVFKGWSMAELLNEIKPRRYTYEMYTVPCALWSLTPTAVPCSWSGKTMASYLDSLSSCDGVPSALCPYECPWYTLGAWPN